MNERDPRLALIANNVELALSEFGRLCEGAFALDEASVDWVEGFIERQRLQDSVRHDPGALVSVLGSFLGAAIIEATGATWAEDPQGALVVKFANGDWCAPFAKVAKQFELGRDAGEGIAEFYDFSVNFVATGKAGQIMGRLN